MLYLSKKQLQRDHFLNPFANRTYLKACQFFGATLIDRTNTLRSNYKFKIIDPLNELSPITKSFSRIAAERGKSIFEGSGSKQINIFWSGGIDSTTALISLIEAARDNDAMHRIMVFLSPESIVEFPRFYYEVIEPKLASQIMYGTIYDYIDPLDVNITGEHGDQLFGSDKLKYLVHTGEAFRPYEEVLPFLISRKLGTERYTSRIINYLSPQILKSPIEIRTLFDFYWWMNFSLKWQNVSMRLIHGLGLPNIELKRNLIHFFQSADFQKWSISNHNQKIKNDWKSYKFPAKEYIHNYFPDEDYLYNKEKEQSLKQIIVR